MGAFFEWDIIHSKKTVVIFLILWERVILMYHCQDSSQDVAVFIRLGNLKFSKVLFLEKLCLVHRVCRQQSVWERTPAQWSRQLLLFLPSSRYGDQASSMERFLLVRAQYRYFLYQDGFYCYHYLNCVHEFEYSGKSSFNSLQKTLAPSFSWDPFEFVFLTQKSGLVQTFWKVN